MAQGALSAPAEDLKATHKASQHPYGNSQQSLLGVLSPSSDLYENCMHLLHTQTNTHKITKK